MSTQAESVGVASGAAEASSPTPDGATFLVVYRPGPAWLPGQPVAAQPLAEHFRYMVQLYEAGVLKLAGPFTDDTGGALLLTVKDEAQAREVVANDPAVKTRVFVSELHPWRLVPWEQHLKKKKP
jgi:uncharacterized protein YciI